MMFINRTLQLGTENGKGTVGMKEAPTLLNNA